MKKSIIASLLSVALILVMVLALVPTTASAASQNVELDLKYVSVSPKPDGVVNVGEYGNTKIHSVDYNSDEFISECDTNKSINADFYACWDSEAMYLAWVVHSELDQYYSPVYGANELGNMWQHCVVQVMYTPYHPTLAEEIAPDTYTGDYLEIGVTLHEGETPIKCVWNSSGAQAGLKDGDWDFAGNVLDTGDGIEVTYEIRLPWSASGLDSVGNGTQVGLGYAIGDQENFNTVEPNMVEWMDCLLYGKAPKKLAIVTLSGKEGDTPIEVSQDLGKETSMDLVEAPADINLNDIPASAAAVLQQPTFDTTIGAGQSTIITDLSILNSKNPIWCANALLRPTDAEGVYEVVEVVEGTGSDIAFTAETKEGDIVLLVHGDDQIEDTTSLENKAALLALTAGDKVTFLGYDFENKLKAKNAVVYYGVKEGSDVSEVPDESSEAESSEVVDESSEAESSVATESSDVSEDKADDKGGNTGLIIGIVVAVVAIVAVVVVVVVLKKKKA